MSGKTSWRGLWDRIAYAQTHLWDLEAKAYGEYMKALRMALEDYAKTVDPDGFDKYGLAIEEEES